MKRIWAIMLALTMTAGMLSGCGGADEPEAEPTEQATEAVAETAEPEEVKPEIADSWYKISKIEGQNGWLIHYAAEVQNADEYNYWTNCSVDVRLLDTDGNELKKTGSYIHVLEPGKTQAIEATADCETEPASAEITIDNSWGTASKDAPANYIPVDGFEVSDVEVGQKDWGVNNYKTMTTNAKVKNLTDRNAKRVYFTVVFKKDGRIAGAAETFVSDLAAGATGDAEIGIGEYVEKYDDYEVYISATAAD